MKKSLPRDPRWDDNHPYEFFKSIASDIKFLDEVPEAVVSRFKLVKELIKQSYFVYDFLDAAYERALLTLELAIEKRYEEIKGDEWNKNFKKLIKWGAENDLFEDREEVIQKFREFRNRVAHPERYSLLGITGIDIVFRVIEIINGLYYDTQKRVERRKEIEGLTQELNTFLEKGGIIQINSKKHIIFRGSVLFIDNFNSEKTYYFLFWRIFDPKMKDDVLTTPDPILIRAYDFMKVQGSYYISSNIDHSVTVSKLEKEENQAKYNKFFKEYQESTISRHTINLDANRIFSLIRRNVGNQRK